MKTLKIFDNDKEVYSGNCSVNTVILRGRIYSDLREVSKGTAKFSLQLSNGKDKVTGEWNKSTFADCAAFGKTAQRILKEYKPKDELWAIAKYYSKRQNDKVYKGFIIHTIIEGKDVKQAQVPTSSQFNDDYLPF